MRTRKDVASALFWIVVGLGMLWVTWIVWEKFALLESGQIKSMKVWAPVAIIYSGGGAWAVIAKWAFLAFLGLSGVGMIYGGVVALFPVLNGMLVFPAPRRMLVNGFQKGPPMCCQRYLKSLAERNNSFADAEERQRYLRVLR